MIRTDQIIYIYVVKISHVHLYKSFSDTVLISDRCYLEVSFSCYLVLAMYV